MERNMHLRRDRAQAFEHVAKDYERFRPGYPEALRDCLEKVADLQPGSELLEIGVGPGQATRLFLGRGYKIIGNEPGEQLRAVAWESLGQPSDLTLEKNTFETWESNNRTFDLIYSGSAFHWVNPEIGFPKVAQLMRPNGYFALFWNMFPGSDDPLWKEMADVYARLVPEIAKNRLNNDYSKRIAQRRRQILKSDHFQDLTILHFPWTKTFTAGEYIKLLMTYSDHILLSNDEQKKLSQELLTVLEHHGNQVVREWDTVLFLMRRKP